MLFGDTKLELKNDKDERLEKLKEFNVKKREVDILARKTKNLAIFKDKDFIDFNSNIICQDLEKLIYGSDD